MHFQPIRDRNHGSSWTGSLRPVLQGGILERAIIHKSHSLKWKLIQTVSDMPHHVQISVMAFQKIPAGIGCFEAHCMLICLHPFFLYCRHDQIQESVEWHNAFELKPKMT